MRIANITSVYPPRFVGGYELGCADVVNNLISRGHEVCVLTSLGPSTSFEIPVHDEPKYIHRCLPLVTWGNVDREQLEREELSIRLHRRASKVAKSILLGFKPDITIIWCVARLPKAIIFQVGRDFQTGFYISDHWLAKSSTRPLFKYIEKSDTDRAPYVRAKKSILRTLAGSSYHELDLKRVIFTSKYLKEEALREGFDVERSEIIHWGIRQDNLSSIRPSSNTSLEIVYAGQLSPHKGVHTLIEAVSSVLDSQPKSSVRLTIYGGANGVGSEEFVNLLNKLAGRWASVGNIRFAGKVPRNYLIDQLKNYNVFVLPSEWEEPFSISLLEAMSSGLAIIATPTGGTLEILNNENALFFEPGNICQLKQKILFLLHSPDNMTALQTKALSTVAPYTLDRMVDQFEMTLNKWRMSEVRNESEIQL